MRRSDLAGPGRLVAAALAFAACAWPAWSASPSSVVAAERAFAADGLKLGIRSSFLKWSAPNGIVLQPDPVNARAVYASTPPDTGGPPLVWWPLWAGIAQSGDLGFTTGPYTYSGKPRAWYFTVWKRQPDGGWRWLFDGGPPSSPEGAAPQGAPPAYLPVAKSPPMHQGTAFAEIRAIETKLAEGARTDQTAAYLAVLAEDGRVAGSRASPSNTAEGRAAELATRTPSIRFRPIGGEASGAGDLVWTYGDAAWTADGKARRGHYVRIWQRRTEGWKLVFDELLAVPEGG